MVFSFKYYFNYLLKQIFLILFFFISFNTFSQQNTFFKVYYLNDQSYGWKVQQTIDNAYIIAGGSVPQQPLSGNDLSDILLAKIDSLGYIIWMKNIPLDYNQGSRSIKQTYDGGYILTGFSSPVGNWETLIIKTNLYGDTVWTKKLLGMGGQNYGIDIIQTSDGKYMETGAVLMNGVNITKIDTDGTVLWTSFYGITTDDGGKKIIETNDHGFVVLGSSVWSFLTYNFLLKIDSAGNEKWKRYIGDFERARALDMCKTIDNGYIITGFKPIYDSIGNLSDNQIHIIKTDSNGFTLWSKTYGNPSPEANSDEYGMSIVQCPDSNFLVLYNRNTLDSAQIYLMKLSSTGDSLWSKKILDSGDGRALIRTNDNGFAITGGYYDYTVPPYSDNIFLLKTDSLGDYINSVPLLYSKSKEIAVLWPNPFNTSAKLYFSNSGKSLFHLGIFDIMGQCMMSIETNDDNFILKKDNLKEGIYFFRISNESLHYSGKFVVQ